MRCGLTSQIKTLLALSFYKSSSLKSSGIVLRRNICRRSWC